MLLYKYFPGNDYTFKSIASNGLWCHHARHMNDPFECLGLAQRTFDDGQIQAFREKHSNSTSKAIRGFCQMNNQTFIKAFNELRIKEIERYAFCSLSERWDDVLMWSHYGNSHKGIAIGFEFKEIGNPNIFQKVRYVDSLGEYDLDAWSDFMEGKDENMRYSIEDISIKSSAWAYENEWRIWRANPCYYWYKPEEIKSIFFGFRCDVETKRLIAKLTDYLPKNITYVELEFRDNPVRLDKGDFISDFQNT